MAKPCWEYFKKFDLDEINYVNKSLFEMTRSPDRNLWTQLSQLLYDKHEYKMDPAHGNKAYLGVVLKILSGPSANNAATTDDNLSKTINKIEGLKSTVAELRSLHGPSLTRAIVRVPGIDADIDWPATEDGPRLDKHGEYTFAIDDKAQASLRPCSLVWVTFSNSEHPGIALDGRETGTIIGVAEAASFMPTITAINSKRRFQPTCETPRLNRGPAGGIYVGQTVSEYGFGPPIRKIKGKIKTGFYGNGTERTKVHFDKAMTRARVSPKYSITGPAPTSKNAFIWVGHLPSNGYLDLVDRPNTPGRETIIYAPKMLDLTSPIEIKYYLHDAGGFGTAWISGPGTTLEEAEIILEGNDFAEKIAPGIKDLIKDKRNVVLVIPEMLYSKGYGTGASNPNRIKNINAGKPVQKGKHNSQTVRTKMSFEAAAATKEYLSDIPTQANENLAALNRYSNREYTTFDNSVTGGYLDRLHDDVIGVLNTFLGVPSESIKFVSILGDGLGAITLASMAARSLDNSIEFNKMDVKRIDFVPNGTDLLGHYIFKGLPSQTLWKKFIKEKAVIDKAGFFEFNYITEHPSERTSAGKFFDSIDLADQFLKNFKSYRGKGERKFSAHTTNDVLSKSTVSMHLSTDKTAYAMSMINNFSTSLEPVLLKSPSDHSQEPVIDSIPNHAAAMSAKKSDSAIGKLSKDLVSLEPKISIFEKMLEQMKIDPSALCSQGSSSYFCKNGILYLAKDGELYKQYQKYLENKKLYMETLLLISHENELKSLLNRETIKSFVSNVSNLRKSAIENKKENKETWDAIAYSFNISNFTDPENNYFLLDNPTQGSIASLAQIMVLPDALAKYEVKLKEKLKSFENNEIPEVPIDCGDNPVPLKSIYSNSKIEVKPTPPGGAKASTPTVKCDGADVTRPNNELELTRLIPYYPEKTDFKRKKKKDQTGLKDIESFKVKRFQYRSRGVGKKSPKPLWECIVPLIEQAWQKACDDSGYVPFVVINGIRGYGEFSNADVARDEGMSTHAWGLGFDMDPFIAGYSKTRMAHSVYTGAWTKGIGDNQRLVELGVFSNSVEDNKKNIYNGNGTGEPRTFTLGADKNNWKKADRHSVYKVQTGKAWGEIIANQLAGKDVEIVPNGADPTKWLVTFCKESGMIWGNSYFLKKRYVSGRWRPQNWTPEQRKEISEIYGFKDVDLVKVIDDISWGSTHADDHMHFQFFKRRSLISWAELAKAKQKNKK